MHCIVRSRHNSISRRHELGRGDVVLLHPPAPATTCPALSWLRTVTCSRTARQPRLGPVKDPVSRTGIAVNRVWYAAITHPAQAGGQPIHPRQRREDDSARDEDTSYAAS